MLLNCLLKTLPKREEAVTGTDVAAIDIVTVGTVMATGTSIVVVAIVITTVAIGMLLRGGCLALGWQSVPVQLHQVAVVAM